jgi:hypothetical protein
MFGTPPDPQAVHQEVPLYSKVVVKGREFYVPSSPKRVLDIVDLTEPRRPKALESRSGRSSRRGRRGVRIRSHY